MKDLELMKSHLHNSLNQHKEETDQDSSSLDPMTIALVSSQNLFFIYIHIYIQENSTSQINPLTLFLRSILNSQ